jgi:small neutral amino acid transporter SnatA (MarC family)
MLDTLDIFLVFDLFFLLLIGMGPKVALVPFLDITANLEDDTRKRVARQMVRTGVGMALVLVVLGGLLMKLLHFTPGALSVGGGIVLMLLAIGMVMSSPDSEKEHEAVSEEQAMRTARYPLGVPYLLNPAGIVTLVTVSGDVDSLLILAVVIVVVLVVGAFDLWVFTGISGIVKHLDPDRMMVTEKLFGVLLVGLAVQLALDGLVTLGLITLA